MSVSLQKGQKVSLTKDNPSLGIIVVGLGWDAVQPQNAGKVQDFDCDAAAILLQNGKFVQKSDLVYYANLAHHSGVVEHLGDNLTGDGEGDDERIIVDLASMPAEYDRIIITVNIFDCVARKQHFGMIENAFVRIIDAKTQNEMCKFNLTEKYDGMTAMIFGELYRKDGEWKFNAIGQGTTDSSLTEIVKRYC